MKKNVIALLFLSAGLAAGVPARAQESPCGFDRQQKLLMENPQYRDALKNGMRKARAVKPADFHQGKYVIPVVFHVFGNQFNGNTTLSLEKIQDALNKTNNDFQGNNPDWNATGESSRFETIKKPLDIEFRLAKLDPDGRPCTGVNFYEEKSGFGNGGGHDDEIRKYAWDNRKYMNVYIMRDLYADGDYYNSGVAWLPVDYMVENNTARVVYNGSYIGINTDENFRRVLTHEFGHFMGLHHTFEGGCTYPNDEVEDTPPVATSKWPKDQVNCEGNYTDWQNFMNYTDAYLHFTAGQVERMEQYLNTSPRMMLWQETNLQATGVNDGFVERPAVISSGNVFNETKKNEGYVEGKMLLTAANGMTFLKTGTLTEGTDYEIAGLPAGLTASVTLDNETSGSVVLSGQAAEHNLSNSAIDKLLTLKGALLSTGNDETLKYSVYFLDPYHALCKFEPRYSQYAYIHKVEFRNIRITTDYDGEQWADFGNEYVAGLEPGQSYTLKATIQNWSSGENDTYGVRMWVDWNGDFILDNDEYIGMKKINKIGKPGTETEVIFDVDVPETAVRNQEFRFRIMLHYYQGNEGADPCGTIDSGDVKDFGAVIGEGRNPDDEKPDRPETMCIPDFSYRPYAIITRVEANGMVNETPDLTDQNPVYEDFRTRTDLRPTLKTGTTYTVSVTCKNIDSSKDDSYRLRLYFDWDDSNTLEKDETYTYDMKAIGNPGKSTTHEFEVTVPENAVTSKPVVMRAFLHYGLGMAGELPCGTVENGQAEDYLVNITGGSGLETLQSRPLRIYPNPSDGMVTVDTPSPITGYSLYTLEGTLVAENAQTTDRFDLRGNPQGAYILKIRTRTGIMQTMIIIR